MGLGEIRLGEMGLGEMGLGEMGQNPFWNSRLESIFSLTVSTSHVSMRFPLNLLRCNE